MVIPSTVCILCLASFETVICIDALIKEAMLRDKHMANYKCAGGPYL